MASYDATIFAKFYEDTDRTKNVKAYIITGSPVSTDKNSVLHWRIYLQIESNSVLLDMSPFAADGRTGILAISSKDYPFSSSSKATYSIKPSSTITTEAVIDFLYKNGKTHYKFDDAGQGCRFWCVDVVGLLETYGYVEPGSRLKFEKFVEDRNKENPSRYPLPTKEGTFY